MKRNTLKILSIFLIFIFGFFLIRTVVYLEKNADDKTKIIFFGLGKADSIYIEKNSKNILIDAGLKSQKETLIKKLEDLKVEKLDYVILTHADKDHIGSASYILDNFEIGEVIQSHNIKNTGRQERIDQVIKKKNLKNIRPIEDMNFELDDLNITIFIPKKNYYELDNDYSLITLIEDGDLNYLFAGDAERELLSELLEIDLPEIDLYKVAHHGRKNSNSEEMINKILPKYSIITNNQGKGEVDSFLEAINSKIIYSSDKDIEITSNGKSLKFK